MAVFSRSIFQSMLDRLEAEAPEAEADSVGGHRMQGLKSGFAFDVGASTGPGIAVDDAYSAFSQDKTIDDSPVLLPAHLARLTDGEIAEDLGLAPDAGFAELVAKRRAFARDNHPDLVHPDHADNATIRMKIANQLIDKALRDLRDRGGA